jgi:choline dehydrogenase-like flavoprotein
MRWVRAWAHVRGLRVDTIDGWPLVHVLGPSRDTEIICVDPALEYDNVHMVTNAHVTRLETGESGRTVTRVVTTLGDGSTVGFTADVVVVAAGAVNSAVLLLRSGLANRSDQVGRNFMNHNSSAVLALHPFRRNTAVYQKTLTVNDFYLGGGVDGTPLGNIQLLGKISGPETIFTSGVGQDEIAQQHGMTVGELARFFNGEFMPEVAGAKVTDLDIETVGDQHPLDGVALDPGQQT